MNKVILAIKIVSALWASIIALIKQAEELMPEQGQGAQKLASSAPRWKRLSARSRTSR